MILKGMFFRTRAMKAVFWRGLALYPAALLVLAAPAAAQTGPDAEIGIAKSVGPPIQNSDGTVTVEYTLTITNPNTFDIENVQVEDDFTDIPGVTAATVVSANVTSNDFTVDFTGLADTALLNGNDGLIAGASGLVIATLVLDPNGETGLLFNTAQAQAQTVCTLGTTATEGLTISQWFTGTARAPTTTVDLSQTFTDGTDANGFFQLNRAPNRTGQTASTNNMLLGGAVVFRNQEEALSGTGWVTPPCGATTWELRVVVGNTVGTYLAALAVDAVPTAANIITGNGNEGFQHSSRLFRIGDPSVSSAFAANLASPTGVFLQVDDRGSAFQIQLQERLDGGVWANVPLSRISADKPVGNEIGGRAVSDISDNGTDPDPASTNGAGGVDDPTPVTLPTPAPSLVITKVADDDEFVTVGQDVTYTYTVTNTGLINVRNVQIGDEHNGDGPPPVPGNETLTEDNGTTGDSIDGTLNDGVWDLLAPGDVITFTGTYTVRQADIDNLQ